MRNNPLMNSISAQARSKLTEFEGSDFSSTAWAFSTLGIESAPLLTAISAEALRKISSLGLQQLGTLADLDLPCRDMVEKYLQEGICRFVSGLPNDAEDFERGRYQDLVDKFETDNFGTKGDRLLLDSLGIYDGGRSFNEKGACLVVEYQHKHVETWWRGEGLLHARVVSYAEFDLTVAGTRKEICGVRYQQNGYQGSRQVDGILVPTRLPFNHNVDRSLCSEFQLLESVCQEIRAAHLMEEGAPLEDVRGHLQLFVTGSPCLSCVGAMRQFQLLLPAVQLSVTIGEELHFATST